MIGAGIKKSGISQDGRTGGCHREIFDIMGTQLIPSEATVARVMVSAVGRIDQLLQ